MKCETSAHHLWQRKTQDPEKQKRRSQTQSCVSIYMSMRSSSGLNVTCTWVIGKAPALSSGSACKMDRKVSVPSNPSPARNACITGMTDSSRSSPWTRPSRYVSRKHLHWGNTKPFKKHLTNSLLLFSKDTHIKVTVNAFIRLHFFFFFTLFFYILYSSKNPEKQQISILWFLKGYMTLKTREMMLKIQLCITASKNTFKCVQIKKHLF